MELSEVIRRPRSHSLSPPLRGEGWGEGLLSANPTARRSPRRLPLTRIASNDAIRPLRASFARLDPASGARQRERARQHRTNIGSVTTIKTPPAYSQIPPAPLPLRPTASARG